MKKELDIRVSIADRQYAVKVKPEDEEVVTRAVQKIGERVQEYSERYAFKDNQDLLAMALLQHSTLLAKFEFEEEKKKNRFIEDLLYIESLLTI
ncbi:MAG: cell division protein ZapA [Bacteroidetes bacterium]|nr:MAG: cell division protein ZapA [Bacteroidota bacterium]PIE87880.1 MAG: cell division protein ZapA [Bacteroidota bacterium]